MKQLLYKAIMLASIQGLINFSVRAQKNDAVESQRIIESKHYLFKAQSAMSQLGSTRQLAPEYDLLVSGDSVVAYLPYFGRVYSAPINPDDAGVNFTSARADYILTEKTKSLEITIKPRDVSEKWELYLTVFDNGNASLTVNSINRQPITYSGYIVEAKSHGKKAF